MVDNRLTQAAPALALGAVILLGWFLVGALVPQVPTLPGTVGAIVDGVADSSLLDRAGETLQSFATGFVVAAAIGLIVGVALGTSAYLSAAVEPIVVVLYAVPRLVLLPVFLALLGIGYWSTVALAVASGLFPVLFYTLDGVRNLPRTYRRLGRVFRANALQMLVKVILPGIAPSFIVGLRIAFSVTLVNVAASELIVGSRGLGQALQRAYAVGDLEKMMAVGIVLLAIAIVGSLSLLAIGRRFGAQGTAYKDAV